MKMKCMTWNENEMKNDMQSDDLTWYVLISFALTWNEMIQDMIWFKILEYEMTCIWYEMKYDVIWHDLKWYRLVWN